MRWSVAGASCRQSEGLVEQQRPPADRHATMQSTRRNTLIKALAYSAAVRAARRRARARSITGPSISSWNASQPMQRLA